MSNQLLARFLDRFPSLKRPYFAWKMGVPLSEVPPGVRIIGLTRPPEHVFEAFRKLHGIDSGPEVSE